MKNNKKVMIGSLALVGAVCVGSTLAYLTDQSNTLTNSFTVGDGYVIDDDLQQAVWVDEHDYDNIKDDDKQGGQDYYYVNDELRTLLGNTYGTEDDKLQAGSIVTKDPTIRLTEKSVESWVYMMIQYKSNESYSFKNLNDVNKDLTRVIDNNEWKVISSTTDKMDGMTTVVVRYDHMLNSSKDKMMPIHNTSALFDEIVIDGNLGNEATITPITVKACAVQAAYTKNGQKVYLEPNDSTGEGEKAEAPVFE